MELTKEALELIQVTAQKAKKARVLGSFDERIAHVQIGDMIHKITIPPGSRRHIAYSLEALMAYARALEGDAKPVIWHGYRQVVLVLDDEDRRDSVVLPLDYSSQIRRLAELEDDKPAFDQRDFIRLLRLELAVDPAVIAPFRRLDWSHGQTGHAEMQHGKDKLGHDINAEVQGIDELPERLILSVPVYEEFPELRASIHCALDVDVSQRQFRLVPSPGELIVAKQRTQGEIHSRLVEVLYDPDDKARLPIYFGDTDGLSENDQDG